MIQRKWIVSLAASATAALLGVVICADRPAARADDAAKVDFTKQIQPIFQQSCIRCHGVDAKNPKKKPASGLRLDDKEAAMKGGENGKAIIPGNAADSLLYKILQGPVTVPDDKLIAMPKPKQGEQWKQLPKEQLDLIKQWIDQGANWP